MNGKRITVFTPTFNRKYILPKLYQSLCTQSCKDFVWLVVDDGSTDGTGELVRSWMDENQIEIRYYYQENGGKTRAQNKGVELCDTELFVCIDSDDYLSSPSVVQDNLDYWEKHSSLITAPETCGMVSYRRMLSGKQGRFPDHLQLATLSELYDSGYRGETTLVFKTEVLKKNLFPVFEGEKYVTEGYLYDQLDEVYKLLVFPYYSQDCEYQSDGITRNGWDILFRNPKSYRMYYNQCIKLKKHSKSRNMRMYIACSLIANDGRLFSASDFKLYLLLMLPLGLYQYYRLKHRKW